MTFISNSLHFIRQPEAARPNRECSQEAADWWTMTKTVRRLVGPETSCALADTFAWVVHKLKLAQRWIFSNWIIILVHYTGSETRCSSGTELLRIFLNMARLYKRKQVPPTVHRPALLLLIDWNWNSNKLHSARWQYHHLLFRCKAFAWAMSTDFRTLIPVRLLNCFCELHH